MTAPDHRLHAELGRLVRRHAVAERACFPLPDLETAIAATLSKLTERTFVLDPAYLPHTLVPIPRDEVWFFASDGQRVVIGPRASIAR